MQIKVEFHGEFRTTGSGAILNVPKNADVEELLTILVEQLGEDFKRKLFDTSGKPLQRPLLLIAVNNVKAELEQALHEGDIVSIFPLQSIGGG